MIPVGILLDMDGVIYRDNDAVPGAAAFVRRLQEECIPFLFCTNNTERHPSAYQTKLKRIGIDVEADRIYSAGNATAEMLASCHPNGRFFTLASPGLKFLLQQHGLEVAEQFDGRLDGVVIGELRQLDYDLLCQAVNAVRAGTPLYGSNPDVLIPSQRGHIIGCGAIAGMVARAADAPIRFFGKPSLEMAEAAAARLKVHRRHLIVIGDNLQTDIAMADAADIPSILTLSGLTKVEEVKCSAHKPYRVIESVAELIDEPLERWLDGEGNICLG